MHGHLRAPRKRALISHVTSTTLCAALLQRHVLAQLGKWDRRRDGRWHARRWGSGPLADGVNVESEGDASADKVANPFFVDNMGNLDLHHMGANKALLSQRQTMARRPIMSASCPRT